MPFQVRSSVAPNGERQSLVVGDDGIPAWWPNIWLLTKQRSRGKAAGTIANYAYFLVRLYNWAEARHLPLDDRMLSRDWLKEWELLALAEELKVQVNAVISRLPEKGKSSDKIERFLAPVVSEAKLVKNETAATRLNIISDYLFWLGTQGVHRLHLQQRRIQQTLLDEMIGSFLDNVPICNTDENAGRSYDRPGVLRLLEITMPGHLENPFESPEIQLRNHLIVMMLFSFGLRLGELAALKVKDLDFRAGELSIERRPDDPEDPRGRYAPVQKTRSRVMRLELSGLIQVYKNQVRNRYELALAHPYLLVSEPNGEAISKAAIEKVFRELREKVSGLPEKLTPHYLRHAWNYEWSSICEQKGIPRAQAEQMRKLLMGWTNSSKQGERYNHPYIREQADECSLAIQQRVLSMAGEASAAFARMKSLARASKSAGCVNV